MRPRPIRPICIFVGLRDQASGIRTVSGIRAGSGLESTTKPRFEVMYLREATQVALLAGELRREERPDDLARKVRADDARAKAEYVHVVVLHGLMRRVAVVADRGADAREFIGGNRDARAAAADDDAPLDLTLPKHNGHGLRVVGVIHGSGAMRAETDNFVAVF